MSVGVERPDNVAQHTLLNGLHLLLRCVAVDGRPGVKGQSTEAADKMVP